MGILCQTALLLTGPGKYSLDRLFGIKVPRWVSALVTVGAAVGVVVGLLMEPDEEAEPAIREAA